MKYQAFKRSFYKNCKPQYAKLEKGGTKDTSYIKLNNQSSLAGSLDHVLSDQTLLGSFKRNVERIPNNNFLGTRDFQQKGGPFQWLTWAEADQLTDDLVQGYEVLSLTPSTIDEGCQRSFMGIAAMNCKEWILTSIASQKNSVITIGLPASGNQAKANYILSQMPINTVSCSAKNVQALLKIKSENPTQQLKNLVCFDENIDERIKAQVEELGMNIYTFRDIIEKGKQVQKKVALNNPTKESILTFLHTSGSTGIPKAVRVTNQSWMAAIQGYHQRGLDLNQHDVYLSFLDLAYGSDRFVTSICLAYGASIGFYSGSIDKLEDDCRALKPTFMVTVPRILLRQYQKYQSLLQKEAKWKQLLIRKAVQYKVSNLRKYANYQHMILDRFSFFRMVKNSLGGKLRVLVSGSASLDPQVIDFLKVTYSIPILIGYGASECLPICMSHKTDINSRSVGGPMSHATVKIKSLPELGLTTDQDPPKGEICVKGPTVFDSYYNDQQSTSDAFDEEGWLLTGDIALVNSNGGLEIIDRRKSIFKLSQGVYIAPEQLENLYVQSPFIQQIVVYGNDQKSYLVGLVVIQKEYAISWLEANDLSLENIEDNKHLQQEILKQLDELCVKQKLSSLEKIRKIKITCNLLTIENNALTDSLKLRRQFVYKEFKEMFEALYVE